MSEIVINSTDQIVVRNLRPMIEARKLGDVLAYHKGGISNRGEPEPIPMIVSYDDSIKGGYYWSEDDCYFTEDQFYGFIDTPLFRKQINDD